MPRQGPDLAAAHSPPSFGAVDAHRCQVNEICDLTWAEAMQVGPRVPIGWRVSLACTVSNPPWLVLPGNYPISNLCLVRALRAHQGSLSVCVLRVSALPGAAACRTDDVEPGGFLADHSSKADEASRRSDTGC